MQLAHRTITRIGSGQLRFGALAAVALTALLAGACGDDGDGSTAATTTSAPSVSTTGAGGDPTDLTDLAPLISCGDAVVVFATPDDTTIVRVQVPDLLALAEEAGGPLDLEFDLTDPAADASAVLEIGSGLATTACNDVPDPGYEVTDSWTADAGKVQLTVAEVPEGPLEACVTPLDIVLATEGVTFPVDGATVAMPDLSHTGAVGWCAG